MSISLIYKEISETHEASKLIANKKRFTTNMQLIVVDYIFEDEDMY